jgi:hypothetical protein
LLFLLKVLQVRWLVFLLASRGCAVSCQIKVIIKIKICLFTESREPKDVSATRKYISQRSQ